MRGNSLSHRSSMSTLEELPRKSYNSAMGILQDGRVLRPYPCCRSYRCMLFWLVFCIATFCTGFIAPLVVLQVFQSSTDG